MSSKAAGTVVSQLRPKKKRSKEEDKSPLDERSATEMTESDPVSADSVAVSMASESAPDSPPPDQAANIKDEVLGGSEKKWGWDARFPGQMLPMVVGPVGLGLCWRRMAGLYNDNSTLITISLVILGFTIAQMTFLLGIMIWKALRHPKITWLEHAHPTHFIFGILITLYFCLISSFIIHWNTTVAKVFWYTGFASQLCFMVYTAHRHLVQPIPIAQMNSFYLFGPLPCLLAIQLAPYAPPDLLYFGWAVGTIWFAGIHMLLIIRWFHVGLPAKRERPAMYLLVAASADSLLGYAAATGSFGEVSKAIFFWSIFQTAVLLSMTQKLFVAGFAASWWMTTLPSSAFSASWMAYGVSINNFGIKIVGTVLCGFTTVWIVALYILTVIYMFKKNLLPKTPYKPPLDTTSLK